NEITHARRTEHVLDRRGVEMQPRWLSVERDAHAAGTFDGASIGKVAMRDRESPVSNGPLAIGRVVGVEERVGGAATRRMRGHLPAQAICDSGHLDQVFTWNGEDATV